MTEKNIGIPSDEDNAKHLARRAEQTSSIGGGYYEITVKGHLDEHWAEWLGDLKFTQDDQGNTLLAGVIPDQAALHGILTQIRDLGLVLISLTLKEQ